MKSCSNGRDGSVDSRKSSALANSTIVSVLCLMATLFSPFASAVVFDVRVTGVMQDNVNYYGGNPYQKFLTQQTELVSNAMIGEAYEFVFRFDTSTPYETDYTLPGFAGGQQFTLLSGSYGGLSDFSMYETQVVSNGTSGAGVDSLVFLLFRDLDEEFGYPGAWHNQIMFTLQDFDGGMFSALANIDVQPFDNSILDNTSASFFIHRNRNGLYTGEQIDTASVFITSVNGVSGGVPVPAPSMLSLMGLWLCVLAFVCRRNGQGCH